MTSKAMHSLFKPLLKQVGRSDRWPRTGNRMNDLWLWVTTKEHLVLFLRKIIHLVGTCTSTFWTPWQSLPHSNCKANQTIFCAIIFWFILWRALGNLVKSSRGTALECWRGCFKTWDNSFLFFGVLFVALDTFDRRFLVGLKVGCSVKTAGIWFCDGKWWEMETFLLISDLSTPSFIQFVRFKMNC